MVETKDLNTDDMEIYDFYLDPSSINLKIVKRIGIEKSSNSIIVEVCNNIIIQVIHKNDLSGKTIDPLKKQLFDILSECADKYNNEKQIVIYSIINCINRNIEKIFDYCNGNNGYVVDIKSRKYFPYNYNLSASKFLPYLTEVMQNMIMNLEIDSGYKIPKDNYQICRLEAVIDCLLYYHYEKDKEELKKFLFEFNKKLFENPSDKQEIGYLWTQAIDSLGIYYYDDHQWSLLDDCQQDNDREGIKFDLDLENDKRETEEKNKKDTSSNKSKQKNYARLSNLLENNLEYEKIKDNLLSLCPFKPPKEQIVKYLKLMYKSLCKELGHLCKQEIIDKIVDDVASEIGISKEQIRRLLFWEVN